MGDELRRATLASLEGRAATGAAQALTEAVYGQAVRHLEPLEAAGATKANRSKLRAATDAFLADLLTAMGAWVYRSLKRNGFTGPVGATAFTQLQQALRELGLVEHRGGVTQFTPGFGEGTPDLIAGRRAARFRATDRLITLAAKYGITAENVFDHFDYGLPKEPLQKRAASTREHGRKLQGRLLPFVPDDTSRKLEADVREINDFLAKQTLGGGIHRGYLRIFQNGDAPNFAWNQGGRLYSQPGARSYQHLSGLERREMTINGEPVVEIDLRASYLTIWCAWHGVQLDLHSDPYVVPTLGVEARDVVKLWVAASFGNTARLQKWPSDLLAKYEEDHGTLDRRRYSVARLGEKIVAQHPILSRWGKPMPDGRVRTWADLMFDESRVIVDTMLWLMRNEQVASFAVHDSIIVARSQQELAARTIRAVYWGHLNVVPLITIHGAKGTKGSSMMSAVDR